MSCQCAVCLAAKKFPDYYREADEDDASLTRQGAREAWRCPRDASA